MDRPLIDCVYQFLSRFPVFHCCNEVFFSNTGVIYYSLGGVHMSPFSRAGPVCQAEINHLEISTLLKNTTKYQNLSYEKKPARSTEISLFSTEIPAKRAEFFSYDNSRLASRAEMAHSAHAHLEMYCFIFDSKTDCLTTIVIKDYLYSMRKKHSTKTPYDNELISARQTESARLNGLIWTAL